jgi:hypothetical protein
MTSLLSHDGRELDVSHADHRATRYNVVTAQAPEPDSDAVITNQASTFMLYVNSQFEQTNI